MHVPRHRSLRRKSKANRKQSRKKTSTKEMRENIKVKDMLLMNVGSL